MVKQHVADAMAPGDHGSTFAGNPLVCHAANTVMDIIADPAFLAGNQFRSSSNCRKSGAPLIDAPSIAAPGHCTHHGNLHTATNVAAHEAVRAGTLHAW